MVVLNFWQNVCIATDAINGKLEGEFLGIPLYTQTLLFVWFPLFLGMLPPPPPPPPPPPQILQALTYY